jgi:hypothetical protein
MGLHDDGSGRSAMFAPRIGALKEKAPPKISADFSDYFEELVDWAYGKGVNLGVFITLAVTGRAVVHTTGKARAATHNLLGDAGRAQLLADAAVKKSPSRRGPHSAMVEDEEAEHYEEIRSVMVYPDVKAEMADTFEEVAKRLNMEDLVAGIPVEQHDCTEAEYIEANQSLWRALTMGADSTITTARRNVQRGCGIDLLIVLIKRMARQPKKRKATQLEMLRMPYNTAKDRYSLKEPADWLDLLEGARKELSRAGTELDDDVFYDFLIESFKDSPISKYILRCKDELDESHTLQELMDGIREKSKDTRVQGRDIAVSRRTGADTGDGGGRDEEMMDCPVGCKILHHRDRPCDKLKAIIDTWTRPNMSTGARQGGCSFCGKPGHEPDRCYKKHPELVKCTKCGKQGHFASTCKADLKAATRKAEVTLTEEDVSTFRTIAQYINAQSDSSIEVAGR